MKTYKIKLNVLTPVNIGTGIEKDPFSFIIIKEEKKRRYISFNIDKLLEANNKDEEILKNLENSSYKEVIESIMKKNLKEYEEYSMQASEKAYNIYNEKLISNSKNFPEVITTMRNPADFKPYIPGSSIKGAIRTSILNSLIISKNYSDCSNSNGIEKKLFSYSSPQDDPMKYLSVSDCVGEFYEKQKLFTVNIFQPEKNQNKSTENKNKHFVNKKSQENGKEENKLFRKDLVSIAEFISYKSEGEFTLTIDENKFIKDFTDIKNIFRAINDTNKSIFSRELKHFEKYFDKKQKEKFQPIQSSFDNLKSENTEAVMRIGRFSQMEYKSFENIREHSNKETEPQDFGKTRTLLDDGNPPGWVRISLEEEV